MTLDLNDKTANVTNLSNVNTVTEYTTSLPFSTQNVRAAKFVASSLQYLQCISPSSAINITGDMTVQCWVRFESVPAIDGDTRFFFGHNEAPPHLRWRAGITQNAGTKQLQMMISDDGSNADYHSVTWSPSIGIWYHTAFVFTAASHKLECFVNGVSQGTDTTGTRTSIHSDAGQPFDIGAANYSGPGQYMDGEIDDVRIYNVARTSGQITGDYAQELLGTESNLQGYWPFEALSSGIPNKIYAQLQAVHRASRW